MARTKQDGISRLERAAMAKTLREKGYTNPQIQAALGIGSTYLQGLLTDPDGSKDRLRKEKYRGTCAECGGKTTYPSLSKPVQLCLACEHKRMHEARKWTRERIIADIQRWNRIYGQPPVAEDWLYYRSEDGDREWPHVNSAQREFGSWSNAIEAAGFKRRVNYERTDEWKAKVTKWPRERIILKMQEWAAEHGRAPTPSEFKDNEGYPSDTTVRKKFGTWTNAVREAGLKPRREATCALPPYAAPVRAEPPAKIIPFEKRGKGKPLLEVVRDLQKGASNG